FLFLHSPDMSGDFSAADEIKEELVEFKDEPVDAFTDIKQEESVCHVSSFDTTSDIKEEPMEIKDDPIDDFKQEEPIGDILCPSTESRPLVQPAPMETARSNLAKPSFVCSHCDKVFSTNYTFNRHMRTHSGEKPFSCRYCTAAFVDKSAHTRHIRQVHKEKLYACITCGAQFNMHADLNVHLLSNRGHVDHLESGPASGYIKCYQRRTHGVQR
ncbi:hypothetical protein PMAYCL1PPCAC_20818, partial [Pristionchus mayeri]